MGSGQRLIASEAGNLARVLPYSLMVAIGDSIAASQSADWPQAGHRLTSGIAHAHYRGLVRNFLDQWSALAADVTPRELALALRTAAQCHKAHQDAQSVELVWTGPEIGEIPFRRTEQALLQVIDGAAERVLIVSYAVYNIPRIREALVRAADRGVEITIIVETPDRLEGQGAYCTLAALGSAVAARSRVFYWPPDHRIKDESGRLGILHVKCAVADGKTLFLTSANLTEYAFTINMELGLLLSGGWLPEQIEHHFGRMIEMGLLASP